MASPDMSVVAPPRRFARSDTALVWLVPAALHYAFLLTAGSDGLFAPVPHGLTFNSMLLHLLAGRFNVDPAAIGDEGYLHGGLTYAYFGVFPALFRAPFLWLRDFAQIDFTRLACLVAVSLMALFKVLTARMIWREAGGRATPMLLLAMVALILLAGPQIQFLRPSIYQEVELWAGAFSSGFVYLLLRGLFCDEGISPRLLSWLALAAGLCLTTRVSNAAGLYSALGLVWLCVAWRSPRSLPALAMSAVIATAFLAITALVNVERWGNPLVFADFASQLTVPDYPTRLPIFEHYGLFNLGRVGFGLGYYFAPFWVLRDAVGHFFGAGFEGDFIGCCVELPASSFFVSDPLLLVLAAYGLVQTLRLEVEKRRTAIVAGFGLSVSAVMMLAAAGMTFRYRMEFYPLFELFAFLGFGALAARPTGRAPVFGMAGALVSIVTAHAMWLLYMLSPFGSPDRVMGPLGIVDFYRSLFH